MAIAGFSLKSGIKEVSISAHQASNPSPFNKGLAVSHDPYISTSLVVLLQIVLLFSSWSGFVGQKKEKKWGLEVKLDYGRGLVCVSVAV